MSHRSGDELAGDVVRSGAAQPPLAVDCSPSDESAFISLLFDSEPEHLPQPAYLRFCRNNAARLASRQDSISSILKVRAHFRFKPVTAFLSINYLDRFLSSHTFPETGWQFQLLSVACLSIAAKMEEVSVPLLLALQILEPTYVFEPKTIQRMELAVMATLKWRLLCVTPFDYLHFFISTLPSSASKPDSVSTVHSLASDIILNTARVIDFMVFPPSIIAAAAVITVAGEDLNLPETFDDRVDKELVRSCHQLMDEYLLDTCPSGCLKVVSSAPHAPPSPAAVLDAADCASCETHSENPASVPGSGSAAAEPDNKRPRSSATDVQEP